MPSEACLVFRRHFLRLKQRIGNPALPVHGNLHLKTICIPNHTPIPVSVICTLPVLGNHRFFAYNSRI
ncbi:TPA: hypothetical protein ACFOL8_001651 [Neisseria meningitidis]|uniref:Uncharacterized protein n=2 Tax=Neisseria meningitidis TaxID=487 RepID=A0A0Y6RXV2_NEIME|nr:hypothetical protein [Neisseria meningitidis]EGC64013.1 hypothetical protein NMB9615945_1850 [Neisseria meningitidis 961-5945]EOC21379.1 hypothetical protein NM3147_1955 [Neisseria meningitidis NM3147]EOC39172.1 hypothetical protein NM2005079_1790 [Neisseria meningitidis 2005079]CBA05902.1 hypothetical protein predicted by Glimmer/Critica [Neisseria meningitidis alpha275]ADY93044.1 hypothetical protein NMBG2136_0305 [Neisseria meningitidis G2136]